ncbi:HAMP domain-containing sensor histidine kinase [Streptomyces sp. SCSIO 30461]|uniref:sensor histidine kinase n=1 Tax=Streptomyces sp. SCSIO 30461 TaxID=3118085 RepID=UPI0030CB8AD2
MASQRPRARTGRWITAEPRSSGRDAGPGRAPRHRGGAVAVVLRAAVDEHRAIGPGPAVDLELVRDPAVRANELRLRQVIRNLLANVRNHTPTGTLTRITAERVGPAVEIRVADNGPGIGAADRPHVFDRFHRPGGPAPAHGTDRASDSPSSPRW